MNPGVVIAIVLVAGIGLLFLVNGKPKRGRKTQKREKGSIDRTMIRERWSNIEQSVSLGGSSNFKAAVMDADKLVDSALIGLGIRGETMGERLKNAKNRFRDYNDYDHLWFAHKVRNNIAHEISHELNSAEAKRAIEYFKKALKDLGVL